MTDQQIRSALRRGAEPRADFAQRVRARCEGIVQQHAADQAEAPRVRLRTVVLATAGLAVVAGLSARLVTLHGQTPTGSVASTAQATLHRGDCSPCDAGPRSAPPLVPVPGGAVVPSLTPAAPVASPSPTTVSAVPDCGAGDVAVKVVTNAATYRAGDIGDFTATYTNVTLHACALPVCANGFTVTDSSGRVVEGSTCSIPNPSEKPTVLSPGQSHPLGPAQLLTKGMAAGTYVLTDYWGAPRGSTTFTVTTASGGTPAPTPPPSPTPTPILP